jgi:polysaccharide export outer membrane protein
MMDPVHHRVKRWVLGLGLSLLLVTTTGLGSLSTSQSSYLLGPNDVVRIHVYGEDDLTVESRIDGDGNLNFPLLGLVHVAGNTI